MNLAELAIGTSAVVTRVGGQGSFRRRLMEHGLLPGTQVELMRIAPLGDPLELLVRGASLSIRRAEALTVEVATGPRGNP
ncbi:MAG TPA: FeoA family protein [Polyangiaceae bacterium]|nr:FeoA family protein [Polyangiaceae bacterium]